MTAIEKLMTEIKELDAKNQKRNDYKQEVERLENDITELQKAALEAVNYEVEKELKDKQAVLPSLKEKLAKLEREKEANRLDYEFLFGRLVSDFAKEEFKENETLSTKYFEVKEQLNQVYKSIQDYQKDKEKFANEVFDKVKATGLFNTMRESNVYLPNSSNVNGVLNEFPKQFDFDAYVYGSKISAEDFFEKESK